MAMHPTRAALRRRAQAIPLVEGGEIIENKEVDALLLDVERLGSILPEHLRDQAAQILAFAKVEIGESSDGTQFTLDETVLRGIIARSVRAGAGQTLSDIGQPLADSQEFEDMLMLAPQTNAEPEQPPAA